MPHDRSTRPLTPLNDIWDYETELLLNITQTPECAPLVPSVLERCGHALFKVSCGELLTTEEAGNFARRAMRVLDQFGVERDWFYQVGQRESVLPDDFGASVTNGKTS